MKREDLAEQIRGAGFALRYADGPVIGGSFNNMTPVFKQMTTRKLRESDGVVVRRASTCHTCSKRASVSDIEEAIEMASDYRSFARQIWIAINHHDDCDAEAYMPVSDKAKRSVAKARFKQAKKAKPKAKKKVAKEVKKKPRRGKK